MRKIRGYIKLIIFILDILEEEIQTIKKTVAKIVSEHAFAKIQTGRISQALKAICSILGNIEPLDISRSLMAFVDICNDVNAYSSVSNYEYYYYYYI